MLTVRTEDKLAGYRATRAAAELAPERFLFNVAQRAMRSIDRTKRSKCSSDWGRTVLTLVDPARTGVSWPVRTMRWAMRSESLEWRLRAPLEHGADDRAVAPGQGARFVSRTADVQALLDTALTLPMEHGLHRSSSWLVSPASRHRDSSGVGRTGSFARTATRTTPRRCSRALDWFRAQSVHGVTSEARRFEIASALYLARDWAAAETARFWRWRRRTLPTSSPRLPRNDRGAPQR